MKYTLIVLLSAYAFTGSISLDKEIKITSSSKVGNVHRFILSTLQ